MKIKKKKKRPGMAHLKKSSFLASQIQNSQNRNDSKTGFYSNEDDRKQQTLINQKNLFFHLFSTEKQKQRRPKELFVFFKLVILIVQTGCFCFLEVFCNRVL